MVNILIRKYRFIFIALFIFADILLLSLLPQIITKPASSQSPAAPVSQTAYLYDGPNAVTNSLMGMTQGLGRVAKATGQLCVKGLRSVGVGALNTRNFIFASVNGTAHFAFAVLFGVWRGVAVSVGFAGHIVRSGITLTANALSGSISFLFSVPGNITNFFLNTAAASSVIKPSHAAKLPVISTSQKSLQPVSLQLPAAILAATTGDSQPQWPIHGAITTLFGVPHWPYQPTHTGLDISDGQRSGVTPVHPFKPGRVADVVYSSAGLGNHVIIDHGDGIQSVYGHLATISVQPGLDVDQATVVGYEGSTGASTGTHLHFEIRLNGQPVNPMQYVSGRP